MRLTITDNLFTTRQSPAILLKLLLIILLIQQQQQQQQQQRQRQQQKHTTTTSATATTTSFNLLGLFTLSGCAPDHQYLCENAVVNQQGIHREYRKAGWSQCFVDAKNSSEVVAELTFSFMQILRTKTDSGDDNDNSDEGQTHDGEEFSKLCVNRDTYGFPARSVGYQIIITYLTFHLTRLVSYLLYNEDNVFLISLTQESMYPYQLVAKPTFVYSHEASYSVEKRDIVSGWMQEIELSYVAVIYSKESAEDVLAIDKACDERTDSAFCYYLKLDSTKKHNGCYKEIIMDTSDPTEVKEKLNMILSYPDLRFLSFDGYWTSFRQNLQKNDLIKNWERKSGKGPFFIIPFERRLRRGENTTEYKNLDELPGGYAIVDLLGRLQVIEKNLMNPRLSHIVEALLEDVVTDLILREKYPFIPEGVEINVKLWETIPEQIRQVIVKSALSDPRIMTKFVIRWKKQTYPEFLSIEAMKSSIYKNPNRVLQKTHPYCNRTIPNCAQGYQIQHGRYHDPRWNNSYGWYCQLCPDKTYKDVNGTDSKCKPCIFPLTTDRSRTLCYDPFETAYLSITAKKGLMMVALSSAMFLLVISTMYVFIIRRDTPIVKHANRPMTALQLSSHLVLSALPIYTISTPPSNTTCLVTPIIVGIFLTITISINLAKTQKLCAIFFVSAVASSNNKNGGGGMGIRNSENHRRLISVIDWFIVGILVLIDVAVLVVSFSRKDISVTYIYQTNDDVSNVIVEDETLYKELTCNNTLDTVLQLFYAIFIVIANGIQAFRARGLPSYFRETAHVIYSSFSSVVIILVASVIYFVQKSAVTGDTTLMACLLVLNTLNFCLVYVYKLYIVLLKPEKNTVRAFNIKRKEKFDKQFTKTSNNSITN